MIIDQIREMIASIEDPNAPVVLPRAWVDELVRAQAPPSSRLGPEPLGGYTIKQVAIAMQRSRWRVAALVRAGSFPGAYLFMNSEYRIPRSGIEQFLRQMNPETAESEPAGAKGIRKHIARRRQREAI